MFLVVIMGFMVVVVVMMIVHFRMLLFLTTFVFSFGLDTITDNIHHFGSFFVDCLCVLEQVFNGRFKSNVEFTCYLDHEVSRLW